MPWRVGVRWRSGHAVLRISGRWLSAFSSSCSSRDLIVFDRRKPADMILSGINSLTLLTINRFSKIYNLLPAAASHLIVQRKAQ